MNGAMTPRELRRLWDARDALYQTRTQFGRRAALDDAEVRAIREHRVAEAARLVSETERGTLLIEAARWTPPTMR